MQSSCLAVKHWYNQQTCGGRLSSRLTRMLPLAMNGSMTVLA